MWWVHLSQQPNTCTAAHSLHCPMGWGEKRRNVRRFMDQDKGRVTGEAKVHKQRKMRNSFATSRW